MSIIKGNHAGLGGAGAPGGALGSFYSHTINQSLRIDGAGYLSKTWGAGADSNQIFTFSAWIKKVTEGDGSSSTDFSIISSVNAGSGTGQGYTLLGFERGDVLLYYTQNGGNNGKTYRKFRDYSSWYHFVWQYDTTQSTENDRIKIYVNGEHIVTNTTNYDASVGFGLFPALNSVMTSMNQNGRLNEIGDDASGTMPSSSFYIAEVIMLDGVTQTADAFGETKDSVWIPKAYSGSFGTNGYHLDFADSSAIGNDVSGNNNDWTANNLAASDVVLDSPTNNFSVMNPLFPGNSAVLSEGNLKVATGGFSSSLYGSISTMAVPRDKKIYIEVEDTAATGDNFAAGFATATALNAAVGGTAVGGDGTIAIYNRSAQINGSETDYGSSAGLGGLGVAKLAAGDILGLMCDGATGKVWASRNGTYFKSPSTDDSGTTGDPAGGSHEIGTITGGSTDDIFFYVIGGTSADNIFINFGQDSTNVSSANADGNGIGTFEYAPPTDYLALCSSNMSDITIGPGQSSQATDHFNTVIYTGNGGTQDIDTGLAPDWVWIKSRSATYDNVLYDSVRGATKRLKANTTDAESTASTAVTAFNSSSFSLGAGSSSNLNTGTYVSWNWKAGTSFSNDASATSVGTIDSTGTVNTDAGFAIISYTGTGSAGTIAHGLGTVPKFYVVKNRGDAGTNWQAYHGAAASDPETDYIYLNSSAALDDADDWNDTAPTSSVFSVKTHNQVNASGDTYIAYLFSEIEGYSKFGNFTGNGADDGPFVYTGFRPAWVMTKRSDSAAEWHIMDDKRNPFNLMDGLLFADGTYAESSDAAYGRDFLSNGFKIRGSEAYVNASGGTFIYLAFANNPFKFGTAF